MGPGEPHVKAITYFGLVRSECRDADRLAYPRVVDWHDLTAERPQGNRDQLEVAEAEGDADDGQAEQHARDHVAEREPPAGEDQPEDVADDRWRPGLGSLDDRPAEGQRAKVASFTACSAKGIVMMRMNITRAARR
jgi:hypothetical protein